MPDAVIVDASAVIDAATPGSRFEAFTAMQERFASRAPALLAWEVGNVVHGRKARSYGATPARRNQALELMLAGFELVATDEEGRARCGKLAARHALTFYDASYLELAARNDVDLLLTQDAALLQAARRVIGPARASDLDGLHALLARVLD